jgi:ABC-type transporter Mla maintaining outer membrane lipid asymmetry permease subunit MlaE
VIVRVQGYSSLGNIGIEVRLVVVVSSGHLDGSRNPVHKYVLRHTATGGPAGVGLATGRAVHASLIAVVSITLLVSLAVYGTSGNFNLSG